MIIDLTHCIRDGLPVFPGDDHTALTRSRTFAADGYNNHQLSINMHAGTHIDGPMHLLDIERHIEQVPIDQFIGEGCLIDAKNGAAVDYDPAYEQLIPERGIVVVHTGHGAGFGTDSYFTDHPELTPAFAQLLIRKRTKLVGLDFPSPDRYPFEVHKMLFQSGVLIAENLANVERLSGVGRFEVIALPLRVEADSSVARIIARTIE